MNRKDQEALTLPTSLEEVKVSDDTAPFGFVDLDLLWEDGDHRHPTMTFSIAPGEYCVVVRAHDRRGNC